MFLTFAMSEADLVQRLLLAQSGRVPNPTLSRPCDFAAKFDSRSPQGLR